MSLLPDGWGKQTASLTLHEYQSPERRNGIWRDKVTRSDRESRVTDRELMKKHDSPVVDGFGNLITQDRRKLAKCLVERAMLALPVERQREITPRQKWDAVEKVLTGRV